MQRIFEKQIQMQSIVGTERIEGGGGKEEE